LVFTEKRAHQHEKLAGESVKPRFTPNDANQPEILRVARQIPGLDYIDLTEVGDDCPDTLFGYKGVNYLAEIKTQKGRMRPGQERHHREWPGQTTVIRSPDDLLKLIGLL